MKKPKPEKQFSDALLDELLSNQGRKPEDLNSLLKQITKAVLERAMQVVCVNLCKRSLSFSLPGFPGQILLPPSSSRRSRRDI